MPSNLSGREQILATLAERLDSAVLARLFPGHPPSELRAIIAGRAEEATAPLATPPSLPSPPPEPCGQKENGVCSLFTDGASRGNPGRAGGGAVLFDSRGNELAAWSIDLGICTNNVAEYKALLLGLEQALDYGCTTLDIALDSELIVRQIQGRYKVKNAALLPLYTRVRALLDRIGPWQIRHVPRAENARADELANRGIDQMERKGYGAPHARRDEG